MSVLADGQAAMRDGKHQLLMSFLLIVVRLTERTFP
jgi:hypothetical protein